MALRRLNFQRLRPRAHYVMAHQGILTASELLYEGSDYAAWRQKMEAVVIMHYLQGDDDDVYDYETFASCLNGDEGEDDKELAATIQKSVLKGLLHRVPEDIRDQPFRLLPYLEGLARPLPLLDLPDNIRQRIYKVIFHNNQHDIHNRVGGRVLKDRMPALLQASPELRADAISVFYEVTKFFCSIGKGQYLKYDLTAIKTWANTVAMDNGKHMRKLHLYRELSTGIQFTFMPFGLTYRAPTLSVGQLRVLDKHVAATQAYQKAMESKGESLIMAVTASPGLWEKLSAMAV